eukprot:Gregarina_sp_Pseudo_9__4859@NODE_507_length_2671_cov_45_206307_g478_i0_p4_GENE_NODE_507_length_2671_cov_45_206307_g478_i0NODE_507_length_2671_cov_45_206307_g478_i0_p4_ORF_typecomplete_len169_score32_40ABC_membrane/PF00664_23/9e02ABC_membrane/PF00664_23/0_016DUF3767/PF12597_8/0_18GPR_Gpa2_C/PF11970_8/0_47GPR_Gpa2_C/PF11970_8/6_9e02_NODE_507_length_2671_cov_45_206307_g478_i013271833
MRSIVLNCLAFSRRMRSKSVGSNAASVWDTCVDGCVLCGNADCAAYSLCCGGGAKHWNISVGFMLRVLVQAAGCCLLLIYLFSLSVIAFREFKDHLWRDEAVEALVLGPLSGVSTTLLALLLAHAVSPRLLLAALAMFLLVSSAASVSCRKRRRLPHAPFSHAAQVAS